MDHSRDLKEKKLYNIPGKHCIRNQKTLPVHDQFQKVKFKLVSTYKSLI